MTKKEKAKEVTRLLYEHYGKIPCYLEHEHPWQLLIATILSAQCTDDRVNIVTKNLFKKYKTLEDFANADLSELEEDIKSTGFFRNKAKNIKLCTKSLVENFGGALPQSVEELTSLAGVGRKTANVVRSHIFNLPSVVVDTHVKRISNLLGLTDKSDPVKIEFELMEVLPKDTWIDYNTQVINLGRKICIAGRPKCEECFLKDLCDAYKAKK